MAGLDTFFGNPTSQYADHHMDLTGIGRLLAMSTRREMNSLAVVHYRQEFGRNRIYRLRNLAADERGDRRNFAGNLLAPALFGDDMIHARFAQLLDSGWRIKSTRLSETFDWPKFVEEHGVDFVLLFGIEERGALRVVSSKRDIEPKPGWTVIVLVPAKSIAPPVTTTMDAVQAT